MRTIYQQHRFKIIPVTLVLFSALLFVGCSGYQSVSYYQDGIYGEAPVQEAPKQAVNTAPSQQQSGSYYKNYFAEKASQGIQDDYLFTNAEHYQSITPEQTSAGNYQAHGSWGDQTDKININVIYNRTFGWNWGWDWYNAPYTFGRSAFWGYNYHPWYFTFDHFHNPYYNPYRWGWGYRSPYWNRWNRWDNGFPYWGNRYHNGSVLRNTPTYSRVRGGRGESGVSRSSSRNANGESATTERVQTNSGNYGSLRNNMRRSRNNNTNFTNSEQRQQRDAATTNSRSRSNNSYNQLNNNNSSRSSNSSYSRTRSSSNANFSRTSAGSRSLSSGSSRSNSSTRR